MKRLLIGTLVLVMSMATFAANLALWDFDDPALGAADGAAVPDSDGHTVWRVAATDKSGNGNDLTTWDYSWAGFTWSADSPHGDFSIENAGDYPAAFTSSSDSLPSGVDIQTITPAAFTVEAVGKLDRITNVATIVGRDGFAIGGAVDQDNRAPLYLSVRDWFGAGQQKAAIEFTDVQGYTHAVTSSEVFEFDTWYHIAAVSDGSTLSLYINGILVGQDDMTLSDSTDTSLAIGTVDNLPEYESGAWSVARGLWAGGHGDRWFGNVDAAAISDEALAPESFVLAIPEPATLALLGLGALTMLRKRK